MIGGARRTRRGGRSRRRGGMRGSQNLAFKRIINWHGSLPWQKTQRKEISSWRA